MKSLTELRRFSKRHPVLGAGDRYGGFYVVQSPLQKSEDLMIIASIGCDWDHVSVSLEKRCPTWIEMDYVKRLFFHQDEVVMQLHPAEKDHVNVHSYCLHLWRPQKEEIPLPPKWMVA